jgi:hypothetical protein
MSPPSAYARFLNSTGLSPLTTDATGRWLFTWVDTLQRYDTSSPPSGAGNYFQTLLTQFNAQFGENNGIYSEPRRYLAEHANRLA